MTSEDTSNATGSLAAASGPSQPVLPDGQTADLFGQPPVPVSRSRRRAKEPERMIQGICGRTYFASSEALESRESDLLSLWENRLAERLAMVGSTESALIWRKKASPAGRVIFRLAPSTRHTNGTGCTGSRWSTVAARDGRSDRSQKANEEIYGAKGRPLPRLMLEQAEAVHAYNPTPKSSAAGPDYAKLERSDTGLSLQTIMAAYNPTPTAIDIARTPQGEASILAKRLARAGQTTVPFYLGDMMRKGGTALGGAMPNGSSAHSTEKRGAPNPAFPFWLMGFPDEWISGALAAMRSFRKPRRKS